MKFQRPPDDDEVDYPDQKRRCDESRTRHGALVILLNPSYVDFRLFGFCDARTLSSDVEAAAGEVAQPSEDLTLTSNHLLPYGAAIMKRMLPFVLLSLLFPHLVRATETGIGRPITGLQATSYAGLIPPTPGLTWQLGYAYYSGTMSASKEVPVAGGGTTLGMKAEFQLLSATALYVWDTKPSSWNFASMVTIPFAYADVNVTARLGPFGRSVSDHDTGPYDLFFAPVIASHHFNQMQHISLALYIYAPTGDYTPGRLANLSLNNWTFSPTVGYTQLFDQGTLEFSALTAVDFYTKDKTTDYQNGAVFRIDSLLLKRFPSGWGAGMVGGWIYQLEGDTGPVADRLNGFKGRSLALGPAINYLKKWHGGQAEFSLRWLHEFDVKNRPQGNPGLLTATIML